MKFFTCLFLLTNLSFSLFSTKKNTQPTFDISCYEEWISLYEEHCGQQTYKLPIITTVHKTKIDVDTMSMEAIEKKITVLKNQYGLQPNEMLAWIHPKKAFLNKALHVFRKTKQEFEKVKHGLAAERCSKHIQKQVVLLSKINTIISLLR